MKKTSAIQMLSILIFAEILSGQVNIQLEEVMVVDGLENENICQWAGIATDDAGNIYLTDMMECSLKKFNKHGEFIGQTGRLGQGPGEFQKPVKVLYHNKRLYVLDLFARGISVFTDDLESRNKILTEKMVSGIDVLDNDTFVCNCTVGESGFFLCNVSGEILSHIQYGKEAGDEGLVLTAGDFTVDSGGNIFIACLWKDSIIKITREGNEVWERHCFGNKRSEEKIINGHRLPVQMIFKSIAHDSRENLWVLAGALSDHPSRDVYILAPNGNKLGMITLPEASHIIHIDNEDYLYSRAGQGTALKKFKIVWSKSG
ncbi:hypothetical protein JXO52_17935 [bacterium]|nr:hypothetical protein [bacterium]